MQIARLFVIACTCLLLSGCLFTRKAPLFSDSEAVTPLQAGVYRAANDQGEDYIAIESDGARYVVKKINSEKKQITFTGIGRQLTKDLFIYQSKSDNLHESANGKYIFA